MHGSIKLLRQIVQSSSSVFHVQRATAFHLFSSKRFLQAWSSVVFSIVNDHGYENCRRIKEENTKQVSKEENGEPEKKTFKK